MRGHFFDMRICNPKSPAYQGMTMPQLYTLHDEKEKKNQYKNRLLQSEKRSLYLQLQAKHFIRRSAVLIATKTNEDYSQVMCNIRTRLSMDIMRSVLVAVRGVRGKAWTTPISNVSFNLKPVEKSYEG